MRIKKIVLEASVTLIILGGIFFLGAHYGVQSSDAAQTVETGIEHEQHVAAREPITVVQLSNHELFDN